MAYFYNPRQVSLQVLLLFWFCSYLCATEASFDEKSDEIANILGEDYFEIIMAMKDIYDIGSFKLYCVNSESKFVNSK